MRMDLSKAAAYADKTPYELWHRDRFARRGFAGALNAVERE
ncbi:MAG TPA: hypothetical protein VGK77_10095 [Candidatus Binatia bacterium]